MNVMKIFKKAAIGLTLLFSNNIAFAECGEVVLAEMNWSSAQFMAHVDKLILESGYGCKVSMVPGATMTTFVSMKEKSRPDVAVQLWTNSIRLPLEVALDKGSLHLANGNPISGVTEGWWIPPATAKAYPELKTVLDVLERPDLFPDTEDPSKGAFIGCPAGWGCQLVNANLFRAFEMERKGWKLVDPGSSAGLSGSMTKAVERGNDWFGYYWSPTAVLHKHKMVKVPFGVPFGGSDNWDGCIVKPVQDCANPKPSSWTDSVVQTIVTDKFKKKTGSEVMSYFSNRIYPIDALNDMLVYMTDNQFGGADAAVEFLFTKEAIWTQWVSADVATKIKKAIS